MNQKKTQSNNAALISFLMILGLTIVFAITYVRGATPSPRNSPEPTGTPTLNESSTPTPNAGTQKAVLAATWLAITRTPFDTQVPLPTGTRQGEMVKFSAEKKFLEALNGWDGSLNGAPVVIYAGSEPNDPDQGALVLLITFPDRYLSEKVLTPARHGGVRVVSEQNNRLALLAADGATSYFDVPARRFVDSPTETVPTATPLPPFTPVAPMLLTPTPAGNPYPLPTGPGAPAL